MSRNRLLLLAAALIAFGAGLVSSFHFDDYAIFSDPAIASSRGWLEVWRPEQSRPLTYFTYWLNYQVGGREPLGYHLVSLLAHLACVLLLYELLLGLLPDRAALVAALLFAIHPIQTEAVVYVFARATVLMTLFCLLSLRAWLKNRYLGACGWFALALLAKEECVTFPLFLLLFHLSERRERREWKWVGAMLALSLAAGARVLWATAVLPAATAGFRSEISPLQYLAAQGVVILRYFKLLILPVGFTVDPAIRPPGPPAAVLAWAGIAALVVASLRRFRVARAGFWFIAGLVLLLPSSSVFPAPDLSADRRLYLPMIAFAAFGGLLLFRLRPAFLVAGAVLLAALSVERTLVWRTEQSLWTDAAAKAPDKLRPKLQLARALPPAEALAVLESAQSLAPNDPAVASEMGRAYLAMGKNAEALASFGRALALAPGDPAAFNNRGVALLSLGQRDAARQDFERALALDPCQFDARLNLLRLGVRTPPPPACRYTDAQSAALAGAR